MSELHRVSTPDGSRETLVVSKEAGGSPDHMLGPTESALEVAARAREETERANAAQRRAEVRYKELFNSIDQGFCTIEVAFNPAGKPLDYRFLEVSPSFERQTGIQNGAGRWMREIAPDQDEFWFETYGRVAWTGEAARFEHFSTPLGRWWTVYAFRIEDPQLRHIAVLFNDITERKQAEAAMERHHRELTAALAETERARDEAESAGRAKDNFLAVLSHELRTPLNPVLIGARMLARRRDLPPDVLETMEMIERNVRIEAQLIDELLDLTRISRGKIELTLEPLDLHRVIRHVVQIVEADIQSKSQLLDVALEAHKSQVLGDKVRLQQALWNLLKNASKFTPPKGELRLSSRTERERIVVEVQDTGIGFESEAAERIFSAFEQASEAVTREFGGLGLGLAISKATIDAHDGELRAWSSGANRGATFAVTLPLLSPTCSNA